MSTLSRAAQLHHQHQYSERSTTSTSPGRFRTILFRTITALLVFKVFSPNPRGEPALRWYTQGLWGAPSHCSSVGASVPLSLLTRKASLALFCNAIRRTIQSPRIATNLLWSDASAGPKGRNHQVHSSSNSRAASKHHGSQNHLLGVERDQLPCIHHKRDLYA